MLLPVVIHKMNKLLGLCEFIIIILRIVHKVHKTCNQKQQDVRTVTASRHHAEAERANTEST